MKLIKLLFAYLYNDSFNLSRKTLKLNKYKNTKVIRMKKEHNILKKYNCCISSTANIGEKVLFPHPIGIVIGEKVTIGKNCTIYQNVTIGQKNNVYPTIGNNVKIFPGSVIIGNISVGDNVVIGANSVVLHDVPANTIVAGNPARIIKKVNKDEE